MQPPEKATAEIIAPNRDRQQRWAAALESKDIPVAKEKHQARYVLIVSTNRLVEARAEIAAYESVNWGWPKQTGDNWRTSQKMDESPRSNWPILAAAGFLLLFHGLLTWSRQQQVFVDAGGADNRAILAGEWFRILTALTLHADWVHVLANAIWGTVFGLVAAQTYGYGFVLLFAIATGGIANFATAAITAETARTSIGASTAVMALLGLLTASGVLHRLREPSGGEEIKPLIQAMIGGIALLSLLGTSPGSDVTGHLTGFITGAVFIVLAKNAKKSRDQERFQLGLMVLAMLLVALAWACA
jgi:rhomboid protease GluP